jgi:hypothetical protein
MKGGTTKRNGKSPTAKSVSEILISADGKILAHNISLALAGVLAELNPADQAMNRRAARKHDLQHELPN